jgi:hypothetical protein
MYEPSRLGASLILHYALLGTQAFADGPVSFGRAVYLQRMD